MLTVTADELAHHLRDYLPRAAAGEAIAIVDQGRTVAHLVGEHPMTPALAHALAAGAITLPTPGARRLLTTEAPPVRGGGAPASKMVIADRR